MRIVAGAWRGRALAAPGGQDTRPTADRARQTLFDMLAHAPWSPGLDDAHVLDVFAGTGAFGLEALSRGAATAAFVEHDRAALATLRANIAALGAGARCTVIAQDATRLDATRLDATRACAAMPHATEPGATRLAPSRAPVATFAFLDPPYAQGLAPRAIAALGRASVLAPGAIVAVETGHDDPLEGLAEADGWAPLADRRVGKARLRILRAP